MFKDIEDSPASNFILPVSGLAKKAGIESAPHSI
jgi:hypothetical protein